MNKNVLFISPRFFGYEILMKDGLEKLGYTVDWFDDRPTTNNLFKAVSRVNRNLVKTASAKYFDNIVDQISEKQYDIFLLVAGMSFSFQPEMISTLRKMYPAVQFVMYCWDSVKNIGCVEQMMSCFDDIYSFDRADTKLFENVTFLPLFYHEKYAQVANKKVDAEYDYSFIGTAHPKKYRLINQMDEILKERFENKYIDLYMPSILKFVYHKLLSADYKKAKYSEFTTEKLSHNEILDIISKSKFILDAPQDGQDGLTIRTIETLGAKRKLVTANADIVNYDFYCPENIYVFEGEFDFSHPFFTKPYKELSDEIYKKYSLSSWLKVLMNVTEVETDESVSDRRERIPG